MKLKKHNQWTKKTLLAYYAVVFLIINMYVFVTTAKQLHVTINCLIKHLGFIYIQRENNQIKHDHLRA